MRRERVVHPDGLPEAQRFLALTTVMLAVAMAVLDGSIVNVALPSIARDQAVSPARAIWLVTAYQLAIVVSLLPLAALGEKHGFRKIYMGGILLFGAASILCAEAPSFDVLVAARVFQGLGAAAIMSINAALVRHIMPLARLARGIGWVAMTVAVSAAAGPTLAAAILSVGSWHWLFLVNVPVSALAVALGFVSLPHTAPSGARFDSLSAVLNALALGCLILALGSIGAGAEPAVVIAQLAMGAASAALLAFRQLSRPFPLFPVDLLSQPRFAGALTASVLAFCAQFVAVVSLPFYFHDVLGYDAVHAGLLLTAWPMATAIAAPVAGRLVDRWSAMPLRTLGLSIFAVGLVLTPLVPVAPGPLALVLMLFVAGAGFGFFQAPNNHILLTSAPRERAGAASGMQSTARLLGQAVGATLAAILIGSGQHFDLRALMGTASGLAALACIASVARGKALPVRPYAASSSSPH